MRCVNTAGTGRGRGERDQFLSVRVRRGSVLQSCRKTPGSLMHCIQHECLHLSQFLGGRRPVFVREHHSPDRRCSHVACQIDAHALGFEPFEVVLKTAPVGRDVIVAKDWLVFGQHAVIRGRD